MQPIRIAFTYIVALVLLAGCSSQNEDVKRQLMAGGFSETAAGKLSTMDLTPAEVKQLTTARVQGMDEKILVSLVERLHDKGGKFVIGTELRLLTAQGMKGETIADLVEIGAIPQWTDDIRALKEARVSDDAIVEVAKLRFVEKKPVLGGGELARLKTFGMSDEGLVRFASKGGSIDQLNKVALELATGKKEDEALKSAGL